MSKVIIDNHLVDLEMITHISHPEKDWDDENNVSCDVNDYVNKDGFREWKIWFYGFKIYVVGCKKPILIYRAWKGEQNYAAAGDAHVSIEKMYNELVKRWSPNTIKFDDITVK